jgi:hypothetical protein
MFGRLIGDIFFRNGGKTISVAQLAAQHGWALPAYYNSMNSDALWEHVSPAPQTRERIVRWLCGFFHRRVGENCGASGPRVLRAFPCLPLERFSGEIIVKGLRSEVVLLEDRVTQLPAENLWGRERSSIGLLLFLVERAAIPEFQKWGQMPLFLVRACSKSLWSVRISSGNLY